MRARLGPFKTGLRMDWFERLTGFAERDYENTRLKLALYDGRVQSLVNGRSYGIGRFEVVSLATLRRRVAAGRIQPGRPSVEVVRGDAFDLHRRPDLAGALFQAASQFNMLEMIGPDVVPEDGVGIYENDRTQGPACAISAGGATIYRNYFVPVGGETGQTRTRQLNGFEALGGALALGAGTPPAALWRMQNGYLMCSPAGLSAMSAVIAAAGEAERERLRGLLAIGLQWGVEVTTASGPRPQHVSQAFCSAVPVSYNRPIGDRSAWRALGSLVLEAAYEATLLAGLLNAAEFGSPKVLLTLLGGGAFGNDDGWILAAIERAIAAVAGHALEIAIVSYGQPSPALLRLAGRVGGEG